MTTYPLDIQPGDRYVIHHDGAYHSVLGIEHGPSHIGVAFDDGSTYQFPYWGGEVVFPRRPDGSTVDWRLADEPPLTTDVYPGDLLQNADLPEGVPPMALTPQQVVSLRCLPKDFAPGMRVYDLSTKTPGFRGIRRYRSAATERVTWPREEVQGLSRRRKGPGKLEWFGPYVHEDSGAIFYFSRHPTGRGRWPSGVDEYRPNAHYERGREYRLRFPTWDWDPALIPQAADLPVGRVKRAISDPTITWG